MGSQMVDGPGELPPVDMAGCYGGELAEPYVVNRDDSNGPGGNAADPNLGQGPTVATVASSDSDTDDRY